MSMQANLNDLMLTGGREKLRQAFRYLEAIHQRRNPPIRMVSDYSFRVSLKDLPVHRCIESFFMPDTDDAGERDFILRVARPSATNVPTPPSSVAEWLEIGWDKPDREPTIKPGSDDQDDHDVSLNFWNEPMRVTSFEQWLNDWRAWAEVRRVEIQVERTYESLYEQYSLLERDGDRFQLVFGDGFVRANLPEGRLDHPTLIIAAELEFNPQRAEFKLLDSLRPVEFCSGPLRSEEISPLALAKVRTQIESNSEIHPLGDLETTGFLKGLAATLDEKGVYFDGPPDESDHLAVYRNPVVFLRKRSAGFGQAIESILGDLSKEPDENPGWMDGAPEGLLRFVGVDTRPGDQELTPAEESLTELPDEDALFTKPANVEQIRIVRKLKEDGCVLVQGPPGTGKTHTIANLIGHLLAKGQSVMVTSHTTKALEVVGEKVVEPLRPLCVSVLKSDRENRERLEYSVQKLSEGLSLAGDVSRSIPSLSVAREDSRSRLQTYRKQLRQARRAEYEPIRVGGRSLSPTAAAKEVLRNKDKDGWIPGTVTSDELPLSTSQMLELYRSNHLLSPTDEENCPESTPDFADLPSGDAMRRLVESIEVLRVRQSEVPEKLIAVPLTKSEQQANDAVVAIHTLLSFFEGERRDWKLKLINQAHLGHSSTWSDLIADASKLSEAALKSEKLLLRVGPSWTGTYNTTEAIRVCAEISSHLSSGRKLSGPTLLLKPDWKRILQCLTVADGKAHRAEHFDAAGTQLRLRQERTELVRVWNGKMEVIGGPMLDASRPQPEADASIYLADIQVCLDWNEVAWLPVKAKVRSAGLSVQLAADSVQADFETVVERLIASLSSVVLPALEAIINSIQLEAQESELRSAQECLSLAVETYPTIPLLALMCDALRTEDIDAYETLGRSLAAVLTKSVEVGRRRELLRALSETAPEWAAAIGARTGDHGLPTPPGEIDAAWTWKQLSRTLDDRAKLSIQELIEFIRTESKRLEEITGELVSVLSWDALARRTKLEMRMALNGYVQTLKKLGKGKGKRAQQLVAEAQRQMSRCQAAVPIWVMPLSRLVESFDVAQTKFDVVIIDEASQLDLMGLIAMYMARQVIIVGDDQQVEPLDVGTDLGEVQALIDEHLRDIPRGQLWDGRQSVYSLAEGPFEPIRLREHFRCVPDIIRFSNTLSYNGSILPLREESGVSTVPFVVPFYVRDAEVRGRVNESEGDALVALMKACMEQPEYYGKTFGAIFLVGDENSPQRRYVESAARRVIGDIELENRRFRCGNSAQFQGDERDIMFLAVVDTPMELSDRLSGRRQAGPLALRSEESFKKRYNVAASRARDQMWVVYSVDPDIDLKPGDLRRQLILHAIDPKAAERLYEEQATTTESDFEQRVLRWLLESGFSDVQPQYKVGAYRIDFVFKQGSARVAIECDGDRFHGEEQLENDLARQETLERLGWKFVRIRGSQFYRNEEGTMAGVFDALAQLGIAKREPDHVPDSDPRDLLRRVTDRAKEFLATDAPPIEETPFVAPVDYAPADEDTNRIYTSGLIPTTRTHQSVTEAGEGQVRSNEQAWYGNASPLRKPNDSAQVLGPYRSFHSDTPLPDPKVSSLKSISQSLAAIAEAEAPLTVRVLLERYRVGAGYGRLKGPTRDTILEALRAMIEGGELVTLETGDDHLSTVVGLPQGQSVNVRERGPRGLDDIPLAEIAAAGQLIDVQSLNRMAGIRRMLELYGLVRQTQNAELRISRALGFD